MHSKRGQVTIFIIIAIAIVALVVMAIILIPKLNKTKAPASEKIDPEIYISDCINDELEPMVKTVAEQGGDIQINNSHYYVAYPRETLVLRRYLCYQAGDYIPCVDQEPMLKDYIEQELKNNLYSPTNLVYQCINEFASNAKIKGYDVSICSQDQFQFNVTLIPGKVTVPINCSISLDKDDEHRRFTTITPSINWPLYELVLTSKEIINDEIEKSGFDPGAYMLNHFSMDIAVYLTSEGSRIYTLRDKGSGKEFCFATRGNVLPRGPL